MKKYKLNTYYVQEHFQYHNELKHSLLDCISRQHQESLKITNDFYGDSITKLDWSSSQDTNRPWVKQFYPKFKECLDNIARECGYQASIINQLWFQQYQNADYHGWHVHGSNFTGVYFLEMPTDAPITQIIDPFEHSKCIFPKIKEGDILLFPSYTIHRAPRILSETRKTIISWNCDFDMVNQRLLNTLDKLADNYE